MEYTHYFSLISLRKSVPDRLRWIGGCVSWIPVSDYLGTRCHTVLPLNKPHFATPCPLFISHVPPPCLSFCPEHTVPRCLIVCRDMMKASCPCADPFILHHLPYPTFKLSPSLTCLPWQIPTPFLSSYISLLNSFPTHFVFLRRHSRPPVTGRV